MEPPKFPFRKYKDTKGYFEKEQTTDSHKCQKIAPKNITPHKKRHYLARFGKTPDPHTLSDRPVISVGSGMSLQELGKWPLVHVRDLMKKICEVKGVTKKS